MVITVKIVIFQTYFLNLLQAFFILWYLCLITNKFNCIRMEESTGENPEIYMDNSITYSGIIRKNDRLSNKQNLFQECRSILQKPHENRVPSENQTILRLIETNQFLKELTSIFGIQFMKGILRNARLQTVDERQVIAQQDQSIKYFVVVLDGKLGVERSSMSTLEGNQNKQYLENLGLKTEEMFEKLTIVAKKERDAIRKTLRLKKKSVVPLSEYQFSMPVLTKNDYEVALKNIERTVGHNDQFGARERLNNRNYRNRVISIEKTSMFIVQINFLFYWLQVAFKSKLAKNIERIKNIPAFQILEEEKISEIILGMKLLKKRKGQIVYSQGDSSQYIYFLVEGQLKISKRANLFQENPNDFYVDRRKLIFTKPNRSISQSFKEQKDSNVLPFANLTTLYNFKPQKKDIQLGLITSFGLFGEEEIVFKTNRQTSIQVTSIQASYYQIQYRRILQIVGVKVTDKFKEALENSVTKKVLYRQVQFAEQVHFQNQKNLNYFFTDQGTSPSSPRKIKLQKINSKMVSKTARDNNSHAAPYYTTFNFNKMIGSRYASQKDHQQTTNQSQNDTLATVQFSIAESKMVDISHTWSKIEKKVKQQNWLSRKISPFKHEINIESPLIDQQFLNNVAKQQRRINKQFRTVRYSLGRTNK